MSSSQSSGTFPSTGAATLCTTGVSVRVALALPTDRPAGPDPTTAGGCRGDGIAGPGLELEPDADAPPGAAATAVHPRGVDAEVGRLIPAPPTIGFGDAIAFDRHEEAAALGLRRSASLPRFGVGAMEERYVDNSGAGMRVSSRRRSCTLNGDNDVNQRLGEVK